MPVAVSASAKPPTSAIRRLERWPQPREYRCLPTLAEYSFGWYSACFVTFWRLVKITAAMPRPVGTTLISDNQMTAIVIRMTFSGW